MRHHLGRWLTCLLGAAAMIAFTATAAWASPPVHETFPFSGSVTDEGQACGDPLAYEFAGEIRLSRFFDADGNTDRFQVQIRESGTVTNLATGQVVDLARTAFMERDIFNDDGSVTVEVVGLSIRVTGPDGHLLDVGRFVIRFDPDELLQSAGQHPIREINPFSVSDPALLGGFCVLFE